MKTLLTLFIFIGAICHCCCVYAQEPSYRIIGDDFFDNKDIYTIIDDLEHNIWIGTDVGLVRYDGNEFITYTNNGLKSNSVFSLTLDNYGAVFCYNLNGQILTMKDDSLQLYYQLPDSLNKGINVINFDNRDNLIISAGGKFLKVDINKTTKIIHEIVNDKNKIFSSVIGNEMPQMEDGTLIFTLFEPYFVGEWLNDKLTIKKCVKKEPSELNLGQEKVLMVGRTNDVELVGYHRLADGEWSYNMLNIYGEGDCTKWLYHRAIGNEVIWYSCTNKGVYAYTINREPIYNNKFFDEYIISMISKDQEGNLWLGTFNNGLLFIPHLEVLSFSNESVFKEFEPTCIELGDDGTAYVGCQEGGIYAIDTNLAIKTILNTSKIIFKSLLFSPDEQLLVSNGGEINVHTKKIKKTFNRTTKEIKEIRPGFYLRANNRGISYQNGLKDKDRIIERFFNNPSINCSRENYKKGKIKNDGAICIGRTNTFYYDTTSTALWIGHVSDLLYGTDDKLKPIRYNGESIIAQSIEKYKEDLYIGTHQGILVFKDTIFKQQILMSNGLLSNKINRIKLKGDLLYVASDNGFQYLDLATNTTHTFVTADGLSSPRIKDFKVGKQYIWLVTPKGVQRIDKTVLEQKSRIPQIKFTSITVNGEPINVLNKRNFTFTENKITFQFIGRSYRSRHALMYQYRLRGTDDDWVTTEQNIVRYNALGAGEYVFEVRAIDQKGNISLTVNYDFCIAIPYWKEWWFVVLCTFGVALIVALFFLIRIQLLKKQNKLLLEKQAVERELMESQQTALRSQMNPHFMFNALNSIQELIMINEKQMAGHYLGKFADLMRIYLNQSQKSVITLSEELIALELYLDLEKVRFEDTLTIHLEVSDKIERDFITLPPMLLQPYIENAFKHGLFHKEQDRILWIRFTYEKEEKAIYCIIEDNGVGRERSAAINQFRSKNHQSFSVSATQKRLELLNYNKQHLIVVKTEDLKNAMNQASGTKVTLKIPLDWNALA